MARPKQIWTSNEVKALTDGVMKHGEGKWKQILDDPLFGSLLANRSNVDLKDKWRNLSGSEHGPTKRRMTDVASGRSSEKRKAPTYETMIYEALSACKDPNGTDVDSIDSYLQGRYKVSESFGRKLTGKLRKLVLSGELEQVHQRYKVKGGQTSQEWDDATAVIVDNRNNEQAGPQNRIELQTPVEPRYTIEEQLEPPQNVNQKRVLDFDLNELPEETVGPVPTERRENAASAGAAQIATAKTLESRVIRGYQDKNTLAHLLDESVSLLTLAEDLYDRCRRDGTVILPP